MNKIKSVIYLAGLSLTLGQSVQAGSLDGRIAPDVGAGKKRAEMCFMCHGEDGRSKMPGAPSLAAQDEAYLEKAIRAYREGTRKDPSMSAMVQPLNDDDIRNIAAYFSQLSETPSCEESEAEYEDDEE